jgi:hypothetical protein
MINKNHIPKSDIWLKNHIEQSKTTALTHYSVWALAQKGGETALVSALIRRKLFKPASDVSISLRQQSISLK